MGELQAPSSVTPCVMSQTSVLTLTLSKSLLVLVTQLQYCVVVFHPFLPTVAWCNFKLLVSLDFFTVEKGDVKVKTEALKRVIYQIINGDKMPGLLMVIIRFVLPSNNHMIKKLLLIFWEIVPKLGQDGKLLQEMILVCDAYRKVGQIY